VTVAIGAGSERRGEQRVSNPHLWEGTLFYLTALALEDPDALLRYEEVLPESQVPAPFTRPLRRPEPTRDEEATECGCDLAHPAPPDEAIPVAVAAFALLARRRRRG
jgi:hypothetical protein